MSRAQRDTGQRYEREIVKRLKPILGDRLRRGYQSRAGGKDEPDITGEDMPAHMHFECTDSMASPWAKLRQAERDSPDRHAIAVCKRPNAEELVAMRWDLFEILLNGYIN